MGRRQTMSLLAGIAALAVLLALLIVTGNAYVDRVRPAFSHVQHLYVYPGTGAEAVLAELADSSNVLHRRSLRRSFVREGLLPRGGREAEGFIEAGHYVIDSTMTGVQLARTLRNGWQTPVRMSVSGTVRRKGAIASKVARQMMVDSATIAGCLEDSVFLGKYGFTPTTAFALVIPDTYEMYWTATPEEIFDKFKSAYDGFWTAENEAKAKALSLTKMEVSILASIVAGETRHEPEMPSIAGVYLNRLRSGMKLQADPTVAYCYDYKLSRILRVHTRCDSPYNTYRYAGLPPGPICSPPKACLNAVLNPDTHGYLFFCASPDFNGTHRFAATYAEHLRNARAFQRALDQRQKNT